MNLYRISQDKNDGYDTFDSAVVAAASEEDARMIHPSRSDWDGKTEGYDSWAAADDVTVKLVGIAVEGTQPGVVCASFNAG